jgi:adenylate cyclase
MGIHWGTPVFERNPITQRMDYFGPVVNKASRISSVADGGQICVSSDVIAALRNFPSMFDDEDSPPEDDDVSMSTTTTLVSPSVYESEGSFPVSRDLLQLKKLGFHVVELGERRLKGLETPECLSLVYSKQLMARIELDKCEMMNSPIPTAVPSTSSRLVSPQIGPTDVIQEGFSLLERKAPKTARTIDPNLVCALSNLAIRLERLTSGHALSQQTAGSSIQSQYTFGDPDIISTAPSGIGLMLDRHLREDATDEELVLMMENCVARVENATSSLYLQKLGTFTTVLEKLGEASQLDPSYIIRALQMYANS